MNKKLIALCTSTALLMLPVVVLAVDPNTWFQGIINNLLRIVILPIFSGFVVIMLLWAGFLFVTAQGDPTKISTAKKAVVWAIVGIAVALLSYSMVKFVGTILDAGSNVGPQPCGITPQNICGGTCPVVGQICRASGLNIIGPPVGCICQ